MRYARQHHKYDCMPVALANALKWAGKPTSYREAKRNLFRITGCSKEEGGVSFWDGNRAIVRGGWGHFSAVTLWNPYLGEIEEHLSGGGAVLLSYIFENKENQICRHVIFVPEMTPDGNIFRVVNNGPPTDWPREPFRKYYLRFRKRTNPNVAYLLSKGTETKVAVKETNMFRKLQDWCWRLDDWGRAHYWQVIIYSALIGWTLGWALSKTI